jgi:2-keto-3-deoxy-L-rhamnonate aldolase RhmA
MFNGSELRLRKAIDEKTPAIGSWIQASSPTCAEILANAGFAWLGIDCEHTSVGIHGVETIARAIHGRNTALLVRVSSANTIEIRQCLDVGAAGVIVPMVETAEQARLSVAAAKYPPQGVRGFCFGRMNDWGASFDEYAASANDSVVVIAMIETQKGVDNIDAILGVEGIDGIFIGPYDMSGSYGVPGQTQHPYLKKAYQSLVDACRRHGKMAGQHIVNSTPEKLNEAVALGYSFLCLDADIILLNQSARAVLETAKVSLRSQ